MNTIAKELNKVASKLKGKSEYSDKIYRLAQELENQENLYNNVNQFDPSQEQPEVNTMLGNPESINIQPLVDNDAEIKEPDATIPIESFIKPSSPEISPDYNVNHCAVTFYAPKDVSKSEMMNYIMGIGEKLSVEVKKFEWEEEDAKPKSSK